MKHNVPLSNYSTMRLGGNAAHMCDVTSNEALVQAVEWAKLQNLPVIVIGEGSNIVWQDKGFSGLVIVNKILGFTKLSEDEVSATYKLGAGEDWDNAVNKLVELGLNGVEALSYIPGKVGATPVQNVGAYGQEISQTIQTVEAYDVVNKTFINIANKDCEFEYRTSCFKKSKKGRYFITAVTLQLHKANPKPPFYTSLQAYLDKHDITNYTPQIIRSAVIAIRKEKMPDWHTTANSGSFFANPIVTISTYESLKVHAPHMPAWLYKDGYKLSAGWLIEQAGFKDYHDSETGMATSSESALVLINEHAQSTEALLKFRQKIIDKVQEQFGITLEQEPELIP